MMLDRDRLLAQLKRQEALRLKPYVDVRGKLTIGYGRNLDDVGISYGEATTMLDTDIDTAIRGLVGRFTWFSALDPIRQAVLVNMAFNIGIEGIAGFPKMIAAVSHGQYGQASDEMIDSLWAKQVGTRAAELAAQMRTGQWAA